MFENRLYWVSFDFLGSNKYGSLRNKLQNRGSIIVYEGAPKLMAQITKVKSSPKNLDRLITDDPPLKFLPSLISTAQKYIDPQEIILFGSRARGDHSKNSDVDIAFVLSADKRDDWPRFVAEIDENLKTLLKLGLVRMDSASNDLKRSIAKEGIVIYG